MTQALQVRWQNYHANRLSYGSQIDLTLQGLLLCMRMEQDSTLAPMLIPQLCCPGGLKKLWGHSQGPLSRSHLSSHVSSFQVGCFSCLEPLQGCGTPEPFSIVKEHCCVT